MELSSRTDSALMPNANGGVVGLPPAAADSVFRDLAIYVPLSSVSRCTLPVLIWSYLVFILFSSAAAEAIKWNLRISSMKSSQLSRWRPFYSYWSSYSS